MTTLPTAWRTLRAFRAKVSHHSASYIRSFPPLPHDPHPIVNFPFEMTPDPTRDTPPPAPRPPHQEPPPAPRKLRRGVRKTRRRRPRSDDQTSPPPACTVCHRRRPLRASGLCWSLACALKMAQDDATEPLHQNTSQTPEQQTRNQDTRISPPSERIREIDQGTASMDFASSSRGQTDEVPVEGEPELRSDEVMPGAQATHQFQASDELDRGRLVEDIERQDKDVNRSDSDDIDYEPT